MKLKMLVSMAGADFALSVNEETERFFGDEATSLIEAGYAAPVADEKVERATRKSMPEKRG